MKDMPSLPLLRTPVDLGAPLHPIGVGDGNVFLGSCFAEHVGGRFLRSRLHAVVNPLGVLYNARSIARVLATTGKTSEDARRTCDQDYVEGDGMWHTWVGDTSLSHTSEEGCRERTEKALGELHEALLEADNLFLTLGTTHYYTVVDGGEVVANCHRLPASLFRESEMTATEVVECLSEVLLPLHERNPRIQVVLTVSPYRYRKYGFHASQLAKSRLLLAVDELVQHHSEWMCYFPAYELMMDELRDYRFYAEDMLHPSEQAVEYIWQRLRANWMADSTREYLSQLEPLVRALEHRPLHEDNPANEAFRQRTLAQIEKLVQKCTK